MEESVQVRAVLGPENLGLWRVPAVEYWTSPELPGSLGNKGNKWSHWAS